MPTRPSFSSSDVVGLYEADTGITLVSSKVSQWDDQSGNANHLTQATSGLRPVMGAGFNGQSAVSFVEAGSTGPCLDTPDLLSGVTACEWMLALKSTTDPPPGDQFDGLHNNYSGPTPYYPGGGGSPTSTLYEAWGSTTRRTFFHTAVPSLASPHIYGVWSASNDWGAHHNGTNESTDSTNTVFHRSGGFKIGTNNSDASLNAQIGAIIIWNKKAPGTARADWVTYFTAKYLTAPPSFSGNRFRVAGFVG